MDFDIFGRNITDKVIKRRFTMPPQIINASASGNTEKHENHIFHSIGLLHALGLCTCALSSWKKQMVIGDVFDSV